MQLGRRLFLLLFFPGAAFAQTTYSCPSNQYVTTQLINTGQGCSPLPTTVTNVSGATSGGFAVSTTNPGTTPVVSVAADGSHYLPTTTDQTNWNAKQTAGSYITALSGDVTASGPGSAAASVVKVNGAALPTSTAVVGTNSSGQVIAVVAQTANTILAAPNGSAGAPTFRALVAADIPTIASTKVSGLAPSATTDTTNASNITSGTLPAAQLPTATTSALGAVKPDGTTITISAGIISASGGGGGAAFQANGTALTSATTVNFESGTGNGGVVVTNPSAGRVDFNLSKPIAGSGAAFSTGPTSSAGGDLASFTGTAGQLQDSGVASSNLGLLNAANVFTANQTLAATGTAVSGTNFGSYNPCQNGSYYTGSAAATASYCWQLSPASNANNPIYNYTLTPTAPGGTLVSILGGNSSTGIGTGIKLDLGSSRSVQFYRDGGTGLTDMALGVEVDVSGAQMKFTSGITSTTQVNVTVGSSIASAGTIAPTNGILHVTGTSAISTITAPSGMSSTVGGCITLIADGAWTTTTSGNIFATMTAVAGTPYSACYDGSKWYIK